MQSLEEFRKLVALDSSPFVGLGELVDSYRALAESLGLEVKLLEGGQSLLVKAAGVKADLLVYNDLETEEPGPHSLWDQSNQNPFEATIHKDQVIGLGVAGSKLSLLCQIQALAKLQSESVKPRVVLFGGAFSRLTADLLQNDVNESLRQAQHILVSRPTSGRLMTGLCGYAKVKFILPLSEKEAEWRRRHMEEEDTSTQTRIFRGRTTHGAAPEKSLEEDALRKLVAYLRNLPEGVLILSMEAGHSVHAVASEAILELNLSQPVEESCAQKLIFLIDQLDDLQSEYQAQQVAMGNQLPRLNVGKLRHRSDHLELGVAFYLPHNYSKQKLLLQLNHIRRRSELYGLDFSIDEFSEGQKFVKDESWLQEWRHLLREFDIPFSEGDSVMKTAARNFIDFAKPMLQFGLGHGLGNVNEPNESIAIKDLERATQMFEKLWRGYA